MASKNRASFRGRRVCARCGFEWFWDELKKNFKGIWICSVCWDPEDAEGI